MADVIEDLEMIVTRAINYLTRILYDLCRRLNENSHRPLNRRTLVRWLAAFMPMPKEPRLRLQTDLAVSKPPAMDRWASCDSLGSAFSTTSTNLMVEEDLDGNIVRYRRGVGDLDEGEDGFEDSTFLPHTKDFAALTSTPKFCSTSSMCSVTSGDLASREKMLEMEEELAALRKQIALLVMAQESTTFVKTETVAETEHQQPKDTTHAADLPLPLSPVLNSLDDSGCESEVLARKPDLPCMSKHVSVPSFVAPAPPPPPPAMLCKQASCDNLSLQQQLQQTKQSLLSKDDMRTGRRKANITIKSVPDMVTILKDLGSVKLRAVERSPGGTPVKRCIEREPSDPASIIAQALKKKFSNNWHFSSESDKENDSSSFASDNSTTFGQHTIKKAKKRLNMHDSSESWTPAASPLKV
ncbi:hypothetical protein BsWGS_19716 [Bradybaena similaris]